MSSNLTVVKNLFVLRFIFGHSPRAHVSQADNAVVRMSSRMLQDDIMYTNLTVEENLLFSAQYRLPVHYTHAQHVYYVERAIQVCCFTQVHCLPAQHC